MSGIGYPGGAPSPKGSCFLDAASGSPLHPVAREALLAALDDGWADPGKVYQQGRRARILLEASRESVADNLQVRPQEVTFLASGTQAVHAGVLGALSGAARPGALAYSAVEHSAVLQAADLVRMQGGHPRSVPVDRYGRVDVELFTELVRRGEVSAAVLMSANHEVGTRQPVDELATACSQVGVPLVVDAAQTAPWEPAPAGAGVVTASSHKWGGPPGVGILVVRADASWAPHGPHGRQERGRVTGAQNVPAIVASAAALRAVRGDAAVVPRLEALTRRIRDTLAATVPDVAVHGHPDSRVPHIAALSFLYVSGDALQQELDRQGFAVSTGSACADERGEPSHVLAAMGALTHGNVRVSLHSWTGPGEVQALLDAVPGIVARLRADAGAEGL